MTPKQKQEVKQFSLDFLQEQHAMAGVQGRRYRKPSRSEVRQALQAKFPWMFLFEIMMWVAWIMLSL